MGERRDDWHTGVDESLITLKTAQRVTDQQLDDLEVAYQALDKILRGDPENDTDGFVARLHNAENGLQECRAELVKLRLADVTVKGFKWEYATKVSVQILILLGILILGWDKVAYLYQNLMSQKQGPLEQKIEESRHPKGKKLYRTRVVPSDDTKESPAK